MALLDSSYTFAFDLRTYQSAALDACLQAAQQNLRRFHLVAPPGSGKTIVGIAFIMTRGERAVVLSPNSALTAQWKERFADSVASLNPGSSDSIPVGMDTESDAPILSLTYQSITSRLGTELHPSSAANLERIISGGFRTLILDECHHLTGFWAQTIRRIIDAVPDMTVLGLTATPPAQLNRDKRDRYESVVGPVVHEIPLPAVVREGHLAPYQDLVYFVEPEARALELLNSGRAGISALLDLLEDPDRTQVTLSDWIARCLEDSKIHGKTVPFDELLRDEPDRAIAYVRYLRGRRVTIPLSVIWIDEMEDALEIDDILTVAADFISHGPGRELDGSLTSRVENLGFSWNGERFEAMSGGIGSSMTGSFSKLDALRPILEREMATEGDDLRVLILADFESRADGDAGYTVVDVMRVLTSDPVLDALDPVMVTGRSVLVDDDLLPRFLAGADDYRKKHGLSFSVDSNEEGGYYRLTGSGRDWNTGVYVSMISWMFEIGVCTALVGTRALLGEGWDSIRLNTLVDLTAVASFVSVNQIRGRSIRKDTDRPLKCANNWDVVTIAPGLEFGLYDFRRVQRKYAHFWGISDDAVIEKGLGHVHPLLSAGNAGAAALHSSAVNDSMLERATNRDDAFSRWAVGRTYAGRETAAIEIRPDEKRIAATTDTVTLPDLAASRIEHFEAIRLSYSRSTNVARRVLLFWPLVLPIFIAAGVIIAGRIAARRQAVAPLPREPIPVLLRRLCLAVLHTLVELGTLPANTSDSDLTISEREASSYRIVLRGVGTDESRLFTEAVYELLGPFQNQRYIIERRDVEVSRLRNRHILAGEAPPTRLLSCHPVPSVFGRRRADADSFCHHWNREVSPGDIWYTRNGRGRELASQWLRQPVFSVRREKKSAWE